MRPKSGGFRCRSVAGPFGHALTDLLGWARRRPRPLGRGGSTHVASDFCDLAGFNAGQEALREHDASLFPRFDSFERGGDGYHCFSKGRPAIPLMYSLRASKP